MYRLKKYNDVNFNMNINSNNIPRIGEKLYIVENEYTDHTYIVKDIKRIIVTNPFINFFFSFYSQIICFRI